jgi:hypothetical protein
MSLRILFCFKKFVSRAEQESDFETKLFLLHTLVNGQIMPNLV